MLGVGQRLPVHGNRDYFNSYLWKPVPVTAGVIPEPKVAPQFDPSREHGIHALRHFYASALLDAGESIEAVSASGNLQVLTYRGSLGAAQG